MSPSNLVGVSERVKFILMLSLSKKTDYALLALSHLTRRGEGRTISTKEIADEYEIPLELLAKILQKLTKEGFLISTSGPTGGYRLAHPSNEIKVGNIVRVLDGQPAIIHCLREDAGACLQFDKCTVRDPLARLNLKILEMLDHLSISEISQETPVSISMPITFLEKELSGIGAAPAA